MSQPTQTVSSPAELPSDIACIRCGYLLHGLESSGKCPECGLEIETTLSGGDLRRADPLWVGRVAAGVGIAAGAMIAWTLLSLARLVLMRVEVELYTYLRVYNFAYAAFLGVELVGWMLYTARSSAAAGDAADGNAQAISGRHAWTRGGLRVLAIVYTLAATLSFVGGQTVHHSAEGTAFASAIILIALVYVRLRQIGRAIGDPFLVRYAPLAMCGRIAATLLAAWIWMGTLIGERTRAGGGITSAIRIDPAVQVGVSMMTAALAAYVLYHAWRALNTVAVEARDRWSAERR